MVFAGVGLVALPLDLVRSFLGRPTAVITKSEYIKRARGLGQRAAAVKARPPVSGSPSAPLGFSDEGSVAASTQQGSCEDILPGGFHQSCVPDANSQLAL